MQSSADTSTARKPASLVAMLVVGTMGYSVIYILPLLVGGMVENRGFTDQVAGYIASADLAGFAVATFVASFWVHRVSAVRAVLVALAVMVLANALTTIVYDQFLFGVVRFSSGMGAGTLTAMATVAIGHTDNPERNFGLLFAAALMFGTLGLWALPPVTAALGFNSAYWLLVVLAVLTALAARHMPARPAGSATAVSAIPRRHGTLAGTVLVAILVFFALQNAVWAYAERIGSNAGLSAGLVGFGLGLMNLTGFAGASFVAWLGKRVGRVAPLVAATAAQIGALLVLTGKPPAAAFVLACIVLPFAWNVVNPLQLAILAEFDTGGRALALSATFTGVGLALGPALAAFVLHGSDYNPVLRLACGLAVLTLALMVPALRHKEY
jgi:MFS family permease